MRKSLYLLIIALFWGCETPNDADELTPDESTIKAEARTPSEFKTKKQTPIQLTIGSPELKNDPFYKSNHYGSFYNDQLSCYVMDIPEGEIAGSKVSKVVLFYIDQVLYKKKYVLESNPIEQIKPEVRKYRVKSLTQNLKSACGDLSNKECADLILAQNKFQFSWKKGILAYELHCWESDDDKKIVLTEEQDDYKMALRFAKFQVDISE